MKLHTYVNFDGKCAEAFGFYEKHLGAFFATRFGQLRDRFGINWMIIHERPMNAPA